eukprot:TRINITY_DN3728_c0_g2_i2.p2 TRINITY_DN3728_c0_g2~~TRINITY_DN3728_c0_g2_i2.p2  ORF type:complete len:384 (+),score=121.65 TRINITY_DN3728_c0_g2_i2:240-1391(+)
MPQWSCSECQGLNHAWRRSCFRCETPYQPPTQRWSSPSRWQNRAPQQGQRNAASPAKWNTWQKPNAPYQPAGGSTQQVLPDLVTEEDKTKDEALKKELIIKKNVLNTLRQTVKDDDPAIVSLIEGVKTIELQRQNLRPLETRVLVQEQALHKAQERLRVAKTKLVEASDLVEKCSGECKAEMQKLAALQKEKEEKDKEQAKAAGATTATLPPAASGGDAWATMKKEYESKMAEMMKQLEQQQQAMTQMMAAQKDAQRTAKTRGAEDPTLEAAAAATATAAAAVATENTKKKNAAGLPPSGSGGDGAGSSREDARDGTAGTEGAGITPPRPVDLVAQLEKEERERQNKVAKLLQETDALSASANAGRPGAAAVFHVGSGDEMDL